MKRIIFGAMVIFFSLGACDDDVDYRGDGQGDGGSDADSDSDVDGDSDSDTDADSDGDADCSESAKFVYVVDANNTLFRFYPPDKKFDPIGKLGCQAGGGTPYSMSVARDGTAYVLHQGALGGGCKGIFPVSTSDASCGQQTVFKCGTDGFGVFGMGFATDSGSTTAEKLYVGNASQFATLDIENGTIDARGPLNGDPEFTGNSKGELWGFFPTAATPKVAQLDKDTGQLLVEWPLQSLSNSASAWAFAFWGGSFYVFYQSLGDASTNVYKVTDGLMENYMMNTGRRIVGAGVSTCAPIAPPV
jgi:hypothetical protein